MRWLWLLVGFIIGCVATYIWFIVKLLNCKIKVGTLSASHNSSSLPRCFYSVGLSCTAKSVQSCNRDFDSCEYRSSH